MSSNPTDPTVSPATPGRWMAEWGLGLFVALYVFAAWLSGAYMTNPLGRLYCWLPLGLYLGWLLRAPPRAAARVVAAAAAATVVVFLLRPGVSAWVQAVYVAGDTASGLAGAWLWRRRGAGRREALDHLGDYAALVLVFALATIPSALAGGLVQLIQTGAGAAWVATFNWTTQAWGGFVLVAPLVLAASVDATPGEPRWRQALGGRPLELAATFAGFCLATTLLMPWIYGDRDLETRYVAMPFVLWAAWRLERAGTCWMILGCVVLAGLREGGHGAHAAWLDTPLPWRRHLQAFLDLGLLAILGQGMAVAVTHHRRVRAEADRLALIARRTGVSVLLTDPEARIVWANESFTANTGYPLEEALGRKPGELLQSPDADPEVVRRIRERVRAGLGFHETILNHRKNGVPYWNRIEVDPLHDARGRLTGFIGVQTDVTLFKNAQQALVREAQLKEFIAEAPVALAMLDRDLRHLSVSRRWLSDYGLGATDLQGRRIDEVFPAWPARWTDTLLRVLATGEAERTEHDILPRRGQGDRLHLRWEARPWRSAQGRIEGIVLFSEDITSRVRAEAALKAETERFRLITQATHDLVWDWDLRTNVQWWNDAYHAFWGRDRASFTPTFDQWRERVHPDDLAALMAKFKEFQASQRTFFASEFRLRRADGEYVACLDRAYALRDESGRIYRMLGAVEDVSARQAEAERRLVAGKLEATGTLAAGIAHDFNNLLAAVLLSLDLVAATDDDGRAPVAPHLRRARDAVHAARRLTDRLLTFAEGGSSARQILSLAPLLCEAAAPAGKPDAVRAELAIAPDLHPVAGERAQLQQVFQNLVANACEAMSSGGVLRIEAANTRLADGPGAPELAPGDYVRVRFADDGPGVPAALATRIFDPYFSTKPRGPHKGLGLGLTIAQSILRRHGGAILLGQAEQGGAVFDIFLPAHAGTGATRPAAPRPAAGSAPAGDARRRVLVMDDEPMLRENLGALLERLGHRVTLCADGREAVDAYASALRSGERFDTVLLDLTVPSGIGGEAAMRELRALDPDVRAIVMSGYTAADAMRNHTRLGFRAALPKPFRVEELDRTIRELARSDGEPAPDPSAGI